MYDQSTWTQIKQILNASKSVLLLCHDHADSDAVNSVAAFGMFLQELKIKFKFAYYNELPNLLFVLDSAFDLRQYLETVIDPADYDAVVVLDTGDTHLLGKAEALLPEFRQQGVPIICIDHHKTNRRFGDLNIVDDSAAAACELLFDLFQDSAVNITPNMAQALTGGIFGDTHILSTSHVTAHTLRVVAQLMDLGADRVSIIERMPVVESVATAKIWGQLLQTIQKTDTHPAIAYAVVRKDEAGSLPRIMRISSFMRDIGDVDIALLFYEESETRIRIEFRARSGYDVGAIAEQLGGGGHRGASGCMLQDMNIDQAVDLVLKTVLAHTQPRP